MKKCVLLLLLAGCAFSQVFAQNMTPSIMVVPYKNSGQTYQQAIEQDDDSRLAVDKLNDGLRQEGIEPIDFIAYMNQTVRATEYEADGTVGSVDKMLLDQSGTDVYITVDMQRKSSYSGNSVALSVKAYDRSTGVILVSKVAFSPTFRTEFYDKLCALAVNKVFSDGFMDELKSAFEEKGTSGSSIVLRIALGDNSSSPSDMAVYNLMQHQTPYGRLSDNIRNWLRENTIDSQYHLKGANSELIIYDKVQMPTITSDGYTMYPDEYASNFVAYLSSLGVIAEERIDANTIYITVY